MNGLILYHIITTFNSPEEGRFCKHLGEKEKMLVTSIFSSSQNVFYQFFFQFVFCHTHTIFFFFFKFVFLPFPLQFFFNLFSAIPITIFFSHIYFVICKCFEFGFIIFSFGKELKEMALYKTELDTT